MSGGRGHTFSRSEAPRVCSVFPSIQVPANHLVKAVSIKVDTTRQVDYSDHDTADVSGSMTTTRFTLPEDQDDYKHTPSNSSIGEKMAPPFGRGDMV